MTEQTIGQTIGQKKALYDLQQMFDYARNSEIRKKWLENYIRAMQFERGEQYDESMLDEMRKIGAEAYVFNRIQPDIAAHVSLQIRSSQGIGVKPKSALPAYKKVAEHVTELLRTIQRQNNHKYFSSLKYKAGIVGGLGCSHFTYENDRFIYEWIDPREIYPDPDDQTPRMEEQSTICRTYFVNLLALQNRYPEHKEYLNRMVDIKTSYPQNMVFEDMYDAYGDTISWVRGKAIRIVEVYYKKSVKYYVTSVLASDEIDSDGSKHTQVFSSFDKEYARSKSVDGKIIEKQGTQIWKGVFCQDVLLEHGAIAAQVPNQKYMPLLLFVLQRDYKNVPFGLVDNLIDVSKAANYLWSTTLHFIDAKLVVTHNATEDRAKLSETWDIEGRKKIGVIYTANPQDVRIYTNENTLSYRFQGLQRLDHEFERATYLFRDAVGQQSNVISGVAIREREDQSIEAQNPRYLAYEYMLLSEGQLMLDTIQGLKDFKYNLNYSKRGKDNIISLDESIAFINFEVYPATVPNFSSNSEEAKKRFANLMAKPNAGMVLGSQLFLEKEGFDEEDAREISEEFIRLTTGQVTDNKEQLK